MNSAAYDRPSFGILLSLLAIGLVLNALRTFSEVFQLLLQEGGLEGNVGTLVIEVISLILVVSCLGMLFARRWLFIPLFAGLLLFNLAMGAYVVAFEETGLETQVAWAAFGVQALIAALWLAYLAKSEHVRDVCCE